jgi:alpha-1,6-mannosyltransferase
VRIVDVCAFYAPGGGGVRTYIEQKLRVAPTLGHDMTVVVPGEAEAVIARGPGARIVSLAAPRFPLDRKYRFFADEAAVHAALDRLAPDFVEVSSPWRSPTMVARWRPAVPKALVMHADPLSAYAYRWLGPLLERDAIDRHMDPFWRHLRTLGRAYQAVVCPSADLGRRLARGGVNGIATVPMGIETSLFTPGKRDPAIRADLLRRCGLPEDATLLITAGRLAPEKRVPMLVRAATLAGRDQPVGLAIFGDGRERKAVLTAIGGNPHIRLFAPETDRETFARLLASADALLHGCEAETFCMAAAEARACGIPLVVPDRGGAADHGTGYGLQYRSADPLAAAHAIATLADIGPRPAALPARSMEDHFAELFALYASIAAQGDRLAA